MPPTHPLTPAHLPWFIAHPGGIDILMVFTGGFLLLFTFLIGVLSLRLHHLPEHIAHKQQKIQYQLVAVLCLLAMLTHQNLFWIAALLLAIIDLPDFSTPLTRIARALERIVHRRGVASLQAKRGAPDQSAAPSPQS